MWNIIQIQRKEKPLEMSTTVRIFLFILLTVVQKFWRLIIKYKILKM